MYLIIFPDIKWNQDNFRLKINVYPSRKSLAMLGERKVEGKI